MSINNKRCKAIRAKQSHICNSVRSGLAVKLEAAIVQACIDARLPSDGPAGPWPYVSQVQTIVASFTKAAKAAHPDWET